MIIFISIGFAYLSASLGIIGQGRFNPAQWGVYFTNSRLIYYDNKEFEKYDYEINHYLQYTDLTLNYDTEIEISGYLNYPGDFFVINVDVVNTGTMDAIANIVSVTGLSQEEAQYAEYEIMYADKQPITQGIALKAGETETISVVLRYKTDITEEVMLEQDKTATFTIGLEYRAGNGTTRTKRKAIFKDGPTVNSKIKQVAGPSQGVIPGEDNRVKAIKRSYKISDENRINDNIISTS